MVETQASDQRSALTQATGAWCVLSHGLTASAASILGKTPDGINQRKKKRGGPYPLGGLRFCPSIFSCLQIRLYNSLLGPHTHCSMMYNPHIIQILHSSLTTSTEVLAIF